MSNLFEATYNPDVLSCIANLSNDEVFTPPELANQMLDLLPQELCSDPNSTFLDPACKSGVFLREIAKRHIEGLEGEFPDLQERLDHIYEHQIYGIAITELTSLLSWCDDTPDGKQSMAIYRRELGLKVRPARKSSMRRLSYEWLAGLREIVIDPVRCPLTFEEFRLKEFDKDRDGTWIDGIPDGNDHSIDAVRYAMMDDVLRGA